MEFTARQIAETLDGTIEGNPEAAVNNLSKIEEGLPGTLSFLANPKYTHYIYTTQATIVIVNRDFVAESPVSATLIRVPDAYSAFAKLLEFYNQAKGSKTGISKHAAISDSAQLGDQLYIGDFVSIGDHVKIGNQVKIHPNVSIGDNVKIGDNTVLYAGTKIYSDCIIGANCTLHAGVVIGADGFGFAPQSDKHYEKVPQIGNVVLEDYVEIGANSTIDRATLGSTIIRKGVKLDNMIQIAHNVEIGENTVVAAQTGISGSTKIGKNCMIGGQVGIVGHITIADEVKIAAQSGIGSSITQTGVTLQGSPAFEVGKYRRSYVLFRKLNKLSDKIHALEKHLK